MMELITLFTDLVNKCLEYINTLNNKIRKHTIKTQIKNYNKKEKWMIITSIQKIDKLFQYL